MLPRRAQTQECAACRQVGAVLGWEFWRQCSRHRKLHIMKACSSCQTRHPVSRPGGMARHRQGTSCAARHVVMGLSYAMSFRVEPGRWLLVLQVCS